MLSQLNGDTPAVQLRDWRTASPAGPEYALPMGRRLERAALDTDSTAVVLTHREGTYYGKCNELLLAYRPGRTTPQTVTNEACPGSIHIRDGKVVYVAARPSLRIIEMGLSSDRKRTLVDLKATGSAFQGFGVDRTGIVFATQRCDARADIWRHRLSAAPFRDPSARCPVRIPRRAAVRRGRLRLALSCPRGCKAIARLSIRKRRIAAGVTTTSSRSARFSLRLSHRSRRLVCDRRTRILVRVTSLDRNGRHRVRSRRIGASCS